jgi:hypothetical protein
MQYQGPVWGETTLPALISVELMVLVDDVVRFFLFAPRPWCEQIVQKFVRKASGRSIA